ncbi:hypothetical protein Ancab_002776 [Ancistrocladus abbreviatus]
METPITPTVDTSSPFHSVKEAVAICDQRFLVGDICPQPKLLTIPKYETSHKNGYVENPFTSIDHNDDHCNNDEAVENVLRKVVAELEETKLEVKLLKERESETEIALASLNAQLHRNMSKMAEAEAAEAAKAAAVRLKDEERRNIIGRKEEFPPITLTQEPRFSGRDGEKYMQRKKKPIIPFATDIFAWKKRVVEGSETFDGEGFQRGACSSNWANELYHP